MTRLALVSAVLAALTFGPGFSRVEAAQDPSTQAATPHHEFEHQYPAKEADAVPHHMMKMHQQMMAEMKAADSRLDALVKDMNAANGDATVNAVAAIVTELISSAEVHARSDGQMHQQGGGGMMMKK